MGPRAITLCAAALLAACNGYEPPGVVGEAGDALGFSDAELLTAAYSDQYTGPQGVYTDAWSPLYYMNTFALGDTDFGWRELCTDDHAQAKAWVDSSVGGSDLGEREDEKFFEFARTQNGAPFPTYYRAHRCSYVYVFNYNLLDRAPERGIFNRRPLTVEGVQELVEYLWYLRYHEFYRYKILSSSTDEHPDSFEHTLYFVTFVGGDFGLCDAIGLTRRTTTVDKASGAIFEIDTGLRSVQGDCH